MSEGKISLASLVGGTQIQAPATEPDLSNPNPAPAAGTEPTPPVEPPAEPDPPAEPGDPNEPAEPGEPQEPVEPLVSDEDIQGQLEFFEEVNKVRGVDIKVEYGDIVPSSVEGIAIRERAIEEHAVRSFQQELAEKDPRGAAYLLHRMRGGSDEEFFATPTFVLPDYELFKEDVNLHRQIYKQSLLAKGLGDNQAQALVELAEKSNNLFSEADKAYSVQQESDRNALARLTQKADEEAKQYNNKVAEMDKLLVDTVKAPDLKVVIPDTERAAFSTFMRTFVQSDGENFYIAQKIEPASIRQVTEALYIQFKKGDLSSVIARQANSLNVRKQQIALGANKKASSAPPPAPAPSNKRTLGELTFN